MPFLSSPIPFNLPTQINLLTYILQESGTVTGQFESGLPAAPATVRRSSRHALVRCALHSVRQDVQCEDSESAAGARRDCDA